MCRSHFEGIIVQIVLDKNERLASILLVFPEGLKQVSLSYLRVVLVLKMWDRVAIQTALVPLPDYALACPDQGVEQKIRHHIVTGIKNSEVIVITNWLHSFLLQLIQEMNYVERREGVSTTLGINRPSKFLNPPDWTALISC